MVTNQIIMKKLFLFVTALIVVNIVVAQKLPNIQTASLRAPANIKIDGKATEWGNQFQAYNKATDVFYILANDNNNLYLLLQATEEIIIKKISRGGITLTINTSNKKADKNAVSVKYPVVKFLEAPLKFSLLNKKVRDEIYADSVKNELNKLIGIKFKEIETIGIKGITDSLISIYNDSGIKVAATFDNQLNYTYELAIPLKYLGIDVTKLVKFNYNIMLNGPIPKNATTILAGGGNTLAIMMDGKAVTSFSVNGPNAAGVYPSDFWGEYTLAK